jgi:peptidoglycan/xylan/chitin deacetylase (PgdA/CDA1 family)
MNHTGNPVILTYHSISEGRSPLKIAPALFAQQMEWLAANARVVSLGTLIDHLRAVKPLPARTVALTFDDGFADFHSHAAPVLLRLRLPATVFLPTRYVGATSDWRGQPSWVEPQPLMSWPQVASLAGDLIQFGSHSVSHPDLSALPAAVVEEEATASQREIAQRTGQPAEFFCYPYGRWSPIAREVVAKHYRGACTTEAALLRPGCDAYALPRVDAHYVRDLPLFQKMFTGPFRMYVGTRRLIRRLRGQPEGGYE